MSKHSMQMKSAGETRRSLERRTQNLQVENDRRDADRRTIPENAPADRRTTPRP